jgi:WD40 repeat protein
MLKAPLDVTPHPLSRLLQVFNVGDGPSFKPTTTLSHHKAPILSLGSAYQSRRGAWTEDLTCELVSCDDDGGLAVWEADASGLYAVKRQGRLPSPATSVAVRRGLAICGCLDGTVRIYSLVGGWRPWLEGGLGAGQVCGLWRSRLVAVLTGGQWQALLNAAGPPAVFPATGLLVSDVQHLHPLEVTHLHTRRFQPLLFSLPRPNPIHWLQASLQLTTEIKAHSRWLSAMDIHPTKDLVATAAEDASVAVWQLPAAADGQVSSCLSSCCAGGLPGCSSVVPQRGKQYARPWPLLPPLTRLLR